MTVRTELARLRKDRGWSQAELARKAGLSPSTIAMYETGRRTPDEATVELLASTLCTSVTVLTANGQATTDGTAAGNSAGTTDDTAANQSGTSQGSSTTAAQRLKQDSELSQNENFVPWQLDSTPGSDLGAGIVDGYAPAQQAGGDASGDGDGNGYAPAQLAGGDASGADLNLRVSADEARVVLSMRMRPAIHDFLLSYVAASDEERERLARTWHVIRSFQTWTGDGTP